MAKDADFCRCLYYTANALSRTVTKMAEEEFAVTGLSPSYAFIMMSLNKSIEGLSPGELAEIMMLTPSTITRLVEKLELKGLVKRTIVGRHAIISATDKGKALNDQILKAWNNYYRRYADILGTEEGNQLAGAIYSAVLQLEDAKKR